LLALANLREERPAHGLAREVHVTGADEGLCIPPLLPERVYDGGQELERAAGPLVRGQAAPAVEHQVQEGWMERVRVHDPPFEALGIRRRGAPIALRLREPLAHAPVRDRVGARDLARGVEMLLRTE
jgi:hypothetical protein